MSWLNSLNNIKGQISNLAQEVLAETRGEFEDDLSPGEQLEESKRQLHELEELCLSKDGEVSVIIYKSCFWITVISF